MLMRWVPANGRIRQLADAQVTQDQYPVAAVVGVTAADMQASWCLAVGGAPLSGAEAVRLYGRRFTIEETFRDVKDPSYGLGMSTTHIGEPRRRDRLLLICAMAMTLLTELGQAGESLGMDRMLKANTTKKRTHSLFRQGCHNYVALPMMPPARRSRYFSVSANAFSSRPSTSRRSTWLLQNEGMPQVVLACLVVVSAFQFLQAQICSPVEALLESIAAGTPTVPDG